MIGRETRMLLRHYLEQGTSKSALARQLGVSRDTIHRWIRDGELDRDLEAEAVRYGPRAPAPTKLDPYKPIIEARLAAYPELSAVRLLDEIRAAGYEGGYTQLKAFVRDVRPTPAPEPVIRFEMPVGRQAQVDFARFRFPWGVHYALLVEEVERMSADVQVDRMPTSIQQIKFREEVKERGPMFSILLDLGIDQPMGNL